MRHDIQGVLAKVKALRKYQHSYFLNSCLCPERSVLHQAGFLVPHWIGITTAKMSGDNKRGKKRKATNRDKQVEEEQGRDTDEKEDKGQEEWHGHLEFPKKLKEHKKQQVNHFTDTRLMTPNKFLPEQTLNECAVPACFHIIGMKGNPATDKLIRAMFWMDVANTIAGRMSHRRSAMIEKIKNMHQGKTNPCKQTSEQHEHELIFNLCLSQGQEGRGDMRKSRRLAAQRF